jgi:hypothetical protein
VLTQDEVGSEVAGGPRFEHGGRIGTELDQKIAELLTLCCVEENLRHVPDSNDSRHRPDVDVDRR